MQAAAARGEKRMGEIAGKQREYQYDTWRFLLIFLVIIGHFMELFLVGWVSKLYTLIYSFHMPAFMFVSGKFAKFDRGKVVKHFVVPYFVFQTLYLWFAAKVMPPSESMLQFTKPYWILWYLMAVFFCYMLVPLLPDKGSVYAGIVLAVSVLTALLVGFDATVGYYLSLSRFFVFLPFFLWGYYDQSFREKLGRFFRHRKLQWLILFLSMAVIALGERYIFREQVSERLLYGSYGYAACGSDMLSRLVTMVTATGWIVFFNIVLPKKKIPVISVLGQNTMPVFLLHAFAVRLAQKYALFHFDLGENFARACMLALVLIAVLGNLAVGKLYRKLF